MAACEGRVGSLCSARIAVTAALRGDPARANMLAALLDGRALTAKELAAARFGFSSMLTYSVALAIAKHPVRHTGRRAHPVAGWPTHWGARNAVCSADQHGLPFGVTALSPGDPSRNVLC